MVIQLCIWAVVATAAAITLNYYHQRRRSRRREQLLIRGLHRANIECPKLNRRLVSTRQSEMETLLANVKAAADTLVAALAAEEQVGARACASDAKDRSLFEEWEATRRADEEAHEVYNQAVQEYREFLHSLAPPLRAEAAKRGFTAMTIARA
jgi:hypothetical protein